MKRENLLDCHGMRFRAKIMEEECEGVITVEDGSIFLCQDIASGACCKDRQGYQYSWVYIYEDSSIDLFVTNFELLEKIEEKQTIEISFIFTGKPGDIKKAIEFLEHNGCEITKQNLIEL